MLSSTIGNLQIHVVQCLIELERHIEAQEVSVPTCLPTVA